MTDDEKPAPQLSTILEDAASAVGHLEHQARALADAQGTLMLNWGPSGKARRGLLTWEPNKPPVSCAGQIIALGQAYEALLDATAKSRGITHSNFFRFFPDFA